MVAGEILDAYPLHRHRGLLDVGGGEGAFLTAAGQRHPQLGWRLFDLPAVAQRGRPRDLNPPGLANRAQIRRRFFSRSPSARGADIISLVRVLHDHDDEFAMAILRRAHAALPKGGIAAGGRAHVGHHRSRAGRRCLFRLLSGGNGQRTAPNARTKSPNCCGRRGFGRTRALSDTARPLVVRVMLATA